MQVGNTLEAAFFARKQPIDGTILIHLLMVFPKILLPILLYGLAEGMLNVVKVLHLILRTKHIAHELSST